MFIDSSLVLSQDRGPAPLKRVAMTIIRSQALSGRGLSSAVSEAIALGLGFNTAAALIAAAKAAPVLSVAGVNEQAAVDYLWARGFRAEPFLAQSLAECGVRM